MIGTEVNASKIVLLSHNDLSFVQLLKPSLFLTGFDCGKAYQGINDFITNYLPELVDSGNIAVYALMKYSTNTVIGLSCIRCNAMGDKALKKAESTVPCIELVIFAVSKEFKSSSLNANQTYGRYLMLRTLELIKGLMRCVGASYVLLKAADSGSGKLLDYYEGFGFRLMSEEEKRKLIPDNFSDGCTPMIMDLLKHKYKPDSELYRIKVDYCSENNKPKPSIDENIFQSSVSFRDNNNK